MIADYLIYFLFLKKYEGLKTRSTVRLYIMSDTRFQLWIIMLLKKNYFCGELGCFYFCLDDNVVAFYTRAGHFGTV